MSPRDDDDDEDDKAEKKLLYQSTKVNLPKDHYLDDSTSTAPFLVSAKRCLKLAWVVVGFVCALVAVGLWLPELHCFHNEDCLIRQELLALNRRIQGQVWFQDDEGESQARFQQAARVWRQDALVDPPLAVVQVATEHDVQVTVPVLVRLYKDFGVPFRIRSGGHSKAGFSTVANGIVLSLQHMKARTIHVGDNSPIPATSTSRTGQLHRHNVTATIEPGALTEDILDSFLAGTANSTMANDSGILGGYAGALGQCGKVAEGGWVLGGGVGSMARLLGLGIDNVLEFRIVLANGTIHVCNPKQNQDLFWALRGAGSGNYGVVTGMKYQLYSDVPDVQLFQKVSLPLADLGGFLYRLGELNTDREFFVVVGGRQGDVATMYMTWFTTDNVVNVAMAGNQHFKSKIRPILPPSAIYPRSYETFLWAESTHSMFDQGYGTSVWAAQPWQGFLLPANNTPQVWDNIMAIMAAGMEIAPNVEPHIELWGGAISDVDPHETAFPYRDAIYNVGVLLVIQDYDATAYQRFHDQVASVNTWWPQVAEYLTGSYLNYPMNSLKSKQYPRLYWGRHLERLVEIKQRYDPTNVFTYEQSIPPMLG
jgi:FAD/FMN-containing dehydrogenase